MDKKEREDIPNKVDLQQLPVDTRNKDGNPEFIDDHVPGDHGAMKEEKAARNSTPPSDEADASA